MGDFRGRFLWYELLTTDPNGAKAFYTKLIGWGTQDWTGLEMPYTLWMRGGAPLGGLMELPPEARKAGAPPHWLPYVGTPSVDDTVKAATGMGAMVLAGPLDVPSVGRLVVLKDPQGAVFAAYTPADAPGDEAEPQLGDVSWHELAANDQVAAFAFYSKLFGWEKHEAVDMGPAGTYQIYGRGGRQLGGMFDKPKEVPSPHWLLYTHVGDVDKAAEAVKASGGKVLNGPMDVPGGDRIVQCLDPQGAAFALHATKS